MWKFKFKIRGIKNYKKILKEYKRMHVSEL